MASSSTAYRRLHLSDWPVLHSFTACLIAVAPKNHWTVPVCGYRRSGELCWLASPSDQSSKPTLFISCEICCLTAPKSFGGRCMACPTPAAIAKQAEDLAVEPTTSLTNSTSPTNSTSLTIPTSPICTVDSVISQVFGLITTNPAIVDSLCPPSPKPATTNTPFAGPLCHFSRVLSALPGQVRIPLCQASNKATQARWQGHEGHEKVLQGREDRNKINLERYQGTGQVRPSQFTHLSPASLDSCILQNKMSHKK